MTTSIARDRKQQSLSALESRDRLVMRLMQGIFTLVPLVAGIDKFFNFLTTWEKYASPFFMQFIPLSAHQVMLLSGPIEIAIGLLVAIKPRLGALAVAAMLFGIMVNLLTMPDQLHLALLDCSLGVLALALFVMCKTIPESN
jgi:hypothetical protein